MVCDSINDYDHNSQSGIFVEHVVNEDPNGDCQNVQVGKASTGPVKDNEVVRGFVFAPTHLTTTGEMDESLILDAFSRGASISRTDLNQTDHTRAAFNNELQNQGQRQAERIRIGSSSRAAQPDRCYLGFVQFIAGEAQAIEVDDTKARVRVYDTARIDDKLHGDLIANKSGLCKAKAKKLRVLLFRLVTISGLTPP